MSSHFGEDGTVVDPQTIIDGKRCCSLCLAPLDEDDRRAPIIDEKGKEICSSCMVPAGTGTEIPELDDD